MSESITFAEAVKKKVSKSYSDAEITNEQYNHPTYYVNSLVDYIAIIENISSANEKTEFSDVVYRGINDSSCGFAPGLAWKVKSTSCEYEMINDFIRRRPEEFVGLSDFDIIAKMQHYGLPTRMLDFTSNPLIALFFACKNNFNKDGRVICHSTFIQNDSSVYINSICSSAISKSFDDNMSVESYVCDGKMSLSRYLAETYLHEDTTVVRPKHWNKRIANQSGVFMLFPNELRDRYRNVLIHVKELGVDKAIYEYGFGSKIGTKDISTALIYEPIDRYREEGTSLLTNKDVRCLFDIYKNNNDYSAIDGKLHNRFLMVDNIKPISREKMENSFCSIIIPHNRKRNVLKELDAINISVDFIFPELEHTAESITERYKSNK